MSETGTTVGAISVVMTGDSVPLEQAITKTVGKLQTVEQRSTTAAAAVARISSRVDELRDKQALLTRVLDEAANATTRDEAKVSALRAELEQTTATLQRLTTAQTVSVAVQEKVRTVQTAATASSRNMGGAVLEASRAFEDMQYGIGGVLNNIPGLLAQLGLGAGVAGVVSILAVGLSVAAKNWGDFGDSAATAVSAASERVDALVTKVADLRDEIRGLASGTSIELIVARRDALTAAVAAQTAGDEFKSKYGDVSPRIDVIDSMADAGLHVDVQRWNSAKQEMETVSVAATAIVADYKAALLAGREAVEAQNAVNALIQRQQLSAHLAEDESAKKQPARAAEAEATEETKTQQYDAVASMFADIKAAGTKSTASWANPEISQDAALDLVGLGAPVVEISDQFSGVLDATADEMASWGAVASELSSEFTDLRSPLERFGESLAAVDFADIATSTAQGGLSAGGVAAGAAIGGVVDAATGGATGGLGAVIGGILGGILGRLLDELIGVLGVLTPVFDALAIVVAALSPIFMVVSVLLDSVAGVIVALVPTLAALAEPIAALLLVAVRIVQALLPFVSILLLGVGVIVAFLEVITIGVQWLDTNFFRPAASAAASLYNGFVSVYNAFIDFIRTIPGFDEFGVKMSSMSTYVEDTIGGFATSLDDLKGVMGDTAQETSKFGRSMTNVPSWYRVPLAEYRAAGGTGGGGGGGGASGGSWGNAGPWQGNTFNGPITFVMQSGDIAQAVRKGLMKMRGVPVGGARRSNDDESN